MSPRFTVSAMLSDNTCATCGARLAPTAGHAMCPRCLLATALGVQEPHVPYRVLTILARDAAAATYLAQALSGSAHVALKIEPRADVAAIVARFRQRAATFASATPPSVARLLDVGPAGDGR